MLCLRSAKSYVHLAAQTQVGDALKNPIHTFKSNIQGTWNILELCRLKDLPIVVASSDKAYGESDILPYQESFPLMFSIGTLIGFTSAESFLSTYICCKRPKASYVLLVM